MNRSLRRTEANSPNSRFRLSFFPRPFQTMSPEPISLSALIPPSTKSRRSAIGFANPRLALNEESSSSRWWEDTADTLPPWQVSFSYNDMARLAHVAGLENNFYGSISFGNGNIGCTLTLLMPLYLLWLNFIWDHGGWVWDTGVVKNLSEYVSMNMLRSSLSH